MKRPRAKVRPARSRWMSIGIVVGAFVLSGNGMSRGLMDETGLGAATKLSDDELSTMRGKFIAADSVTHFGISLQTLWQTAEGVITAARMALNVSFAEGQAGTPQITIGWVRDGDPSMDVTSFSEGVGSNYVAYSADGLPGLNSVSGAVQSNVIGGTDNHVSNAMAVQIVPATSLPPMSAGESISASRTDFAPDGDSVQFVVSAGQLGMVLQDAQGAGVVRQMIADNPGQLSQNVFLGGTANIVENVMNVTIGVDQLRNLNETQVVNSLSAMKGHGF